jgi:hypothetical protein
MRKLLAVALAGLLALTGVATTTAQEAVLGEQAYSQYTDLPAEVKIDLARALLAEDGLNDGMSSLSAEGESVLGEQARPDEASRDELAEMLRQLRARAELNNEMARLAE